MSDAVLGLLHFPWGEDYGVDRQARRSPAKLWRRLVVHKANPRSAEYMRRRFAESYPGGRLVEVQGRHDSATDPGSAELVVLLYPDAIGLGFGRLERRLRSAPLRVLTGRGRDYELTAGVRRRLLIRRALERTMLVELAVAPLVLIVAVVALVFDLVGGRR